MTVGSHRFCKKTVVNREKNGGIGKVTGQRERSIKRCTRKHGHPGINSGMRHMKKKQEGNKHRKRGKNNNCVLYGDRRSIHGTWKDVGVPFQSRSWGSLGEGSRTCVELRKIQELCNNQHLQKSNTLPTTQPKAFRHNLGNNGSVKGGQRRKTWIKDTTTKKQTRTN